ATVNQPFMSNRLNGDSQKLSKPRFFGLLNTLHMRTGVTDLRLAGRGRLYRERGTAVASVVGGAGRRDANAGSLARRPRAASYRCEITICCTLIRDLSANRGLAIGCSLGLVLIYLPRIMGLSLFGLIGSTFG